MVEVNMRKTKIICTLGPSTDNDAVLKDLMINGMDVARFNFSHGDYDEHLGRLKKIDKFRKELGVPVATLLDTKGPEIRIGTFKDNKKVNLTEGQSFTLTTKEVEGDSRSPSKAPSSSSCRSSRRSSCPASRWRMRRGRSRAR
jgi:pyruvate kinase